MPTLSVSILSTCTISGDVLAVIALVLAADF